jgi:hypothetical protein
VDLARIEDRIAEVRHRESMSQGLAALGRTDFETARRAFADARKWRPGSDGAAEGLAAATQELRLASIARLRERATRLESEERWSEATEQYKAVLALDPALAFALEGKARASRRAVLAAELDGTLNDPERLASPQVHERAVLVLAQAAAVPDPGPRLRQQIAVVGRLVELAGKWAGSAASTEGSSSCVPGPTRSWERGTGTAMCASASRCGPASTLPPWWFAARSGFEHCDRRSRRAGGARLRQ